MPKSRPSFEQSFERAVQAVAKAASREAVDPTYWTTRPAFGVAGGPIVHALTPEGEAKAFSVGAKVRSGAPAEALLALHNIGGEGQYSIRAGARHRLTPLGKFDQLAWGRLRDLEYVESVPPDGVKLTQRGRAAVRDGLEQRKYLLERVQRAHPIRK